MSRAPWSDEELDQLWQMIGDMPFPMVPSVFNRWARINGYPVRTALALRSKAGRNRLSVAAVGAWITSAAIAELLGCTTARIHHWLEVRWVKSRQPAKKAGGLHYIRRADLRTLARERPQLFGGVPAWRLIQLLDDEALAKQIAADHPVRHWGARPVRCVETGRRYPSSSAAAAAHHIGRTAISYALRTGGTAAGFHWDRPE